MELLSIETEEEQLAIVEATSELQNEGSLN
jgi:hypothetical protein